MCGGRTEETIVRVWERAAVPLHCGNCPNLIRLGDPVLLITIASGPYAVSRPKYRCPQCAGEPVPDLPLRVERLEPVRLSPMVPVKALIPTLDFKARASGDAADLRETTSVGIGQDDKRGTGGDR